MEAKILFEDNHLIIVNKPAGFLVHGDKTGDRTLADQVKSYIKKKYDKPGAVYLGVIHRLDRPVSGAIIFAKTSKALTRMNQMFKDHKVKKVYHALTRQRPPEMEERITHFILKDPEKNIAKSFRKEKKGAKKAVLDYELIGEIDDVRLLAVIPLTGRPHQIRVQLKAIGCPIIGDVKYNYPSPNQDKSICLHCRSLHFEHPVSKKDIEVKAAYPPLPIWRPFK